MFLKKSAVCWACVCVLASTASHAASPEAQFEPVTVYGTGFDEPLSQALAQTEVITHTQIQRSGLNSVGDVLEKLGHLHMQQDLGVNMNASPDIRGYGATASNNTVILIDGIKISQSEQSAARIWNIPVESIDHIEIIRGSSTVLFGEGATAGVINIITHKQKADTAVVSVGGGSYGTQLTNAYLSKGLQNGKLSVFGKTAKSNGYREQSANDLTSGGLQYDHVLDTSVRFGMRYGQETDRAQLPGFLSLARYALDPTLPQYQLDALYNRQAVNTEVKNKLASVYLKINQRDVTYLVDVSQRDTKTDYMDTRFPDPNPAFSSATDYRYHAKHDAINAKVKIDHFLMARNTLTAGLTHAKASRELKAWGLPYSFGLFSSGDTSTQSDAIFVQDDWRFTAVDRLTVGVRREHFEQEMIASGFQFGPTYARQTGKHDLDAYEVQYSRDWAAGTTAYIKHGQGYRLPNVDDVNRFCAATCLDNLVLKPQLNRDIELGLVYRAGANRGHVKLYQSNITNEILFNKYTNFELGYNVNVPKTRRQGVEFFNATKHTAALTWTTQVNLVDATFQVDSMDSVTGLKGKTISGTPKYTVGVGADYAVNAQHALSWKTRVVGNQYPQGDSANRFELGAYAVTDWGYRWTHQKWSVIANVNNVFNKHYGATVLASTTSANYPYGIYPNWGRNYLLTVRYAFE